LKHDQDFPSAPRQIKRGEDARVVNGKVQVNGQIAVMSINALMAKVIFDKNPTHEFYYEQSIPLDWMYPYLTPHQFIMKLNREPLKEISPEIVRTDHEFWKRQTDSWFGPWLNTNTPVSEIGNFWERIYLKKDFAGFTGDLRFINDPEVQRAFSRMRCAIAALYAWRASNSKDPLERERMKTEADFAFRQALALCPVSPEIIFRYINLLTADNRLSDGVSIVTTAHKLDPDNQMWRWQDLLEQLTRANQRR
jgi:hypothetical protein